MILRVHLSLLIAIIASTAAFQLPFVTHSSPAAHPTFTLQRSIHLSTRNRTIPPLYRHHSPLATLSSPRRHNLKLDRVRAWRPTCKKAYQAQRRASFALKDARISGRKLTKNEEQDVRNGRKLEWEEEDVLVPDTGDIPTIKTLAEMTSDAYSLPEEEPGDWYDLSGSWNISSSFGWLDDGVRGHVFADSTNDTIVIAIKGTSIPGSGRPTIGNDKRNDNLFFSCCCARVSWSWSTVCDCYDGSQTCRLDCIERSVMDDTYYPTMVDLYNNISAIYPHSNIILTGHSLGGALAALLSLTFGVASVSYESPGDQLAAKRLHLPLPPPSSQLGNGKVFHSEVTRGTYYSPLTTHIYNTADPIPMGVCTGTLSTCSAAGFAFETRAHLGKSRVYDTVDRLGWNVDVRSHRIITVIEYLFKEGWDTKGKKSRLGLGWLLGKDGGGVPEPVEETDEGECFKWEFVDG